MQTPIRNRLVFLFSLLLLLPVAAAQAGEEALYAAEAPDGAAFIRIINANTGGGIAEGRIGGKAIKDVEPLEASAYIYLPEGSYELSVGGKSEAVTMASNRFYTAVVTETGELKVLEDADFDNPRKALVSFYNLTDSATVTLKTADGKVAVTDPVAPMQMANREINAVKVAMGAFSKDQALAKTSEVNLQRGKVFSFFAIEVGGQPRLVVAENRVDTSA